MCIRVFINTFLGFSFLQISFKVSRKRMYFNSPVSLSDHLASVHSDLVLDISPHDEPNYQLCRSEMDIAVQVCVWCEGV